ncbi:hypothetical protein MRB53_025935 [Persea americana]|uniref:Uncharacterized protein n=1 Tax=Persea americana TaxID=3435 RepID=A0ACC2LGQ2_PERAE|nr:hypothetical protein MRB53_025935 [Persea americana]
MCNVLRGWCSALGDGGIESDGDRGFSALGGDGEDGGREGWGRDMRDGVHRVINSAVGSILPSGMLKEDLESIFALGRAQLSLPLLNEKNQIGSARLAKLKSIFDEGKSIQLQFPAEDLGFRLHRGTRTRCREEKATEHRANEGLGEELPGREQTRTRARGETRGITGLATSCLYGTMLAASCAYGTRKSRLFELYSRYLL